MLFNSFPFLLVFLPLALVLHALTARVRPDWRLPVLLGLSIAFYGYWDPRFVPLLGLSIGLNWLIAGAYGRTGQARLITLAVVANLLVLGLFKYLGFLAGLVGALGVAMPRPDIALPLGISFFTFHHVMYLVDLRAGRAPRFDLVRYGLYIAFFPQLLAGPLVRWSEVMRQFERPPYSPGWEERAARGMMLLGLGLAKKVFVGDPLAEVANPVFEAAAAGRVVTVLEAWQGALAFALQVYFDFSGYTDMAIGLGLLFGITLPQNFDRPYRTTSLRDFWRRWHMTLSRFLRDYLYVPLGGNRHGLARQLGALFLTMALAGLWHGAGLSFVAWGAAHGLGLVAGVLWRRAGLPLPAPLGWALTQGFVVITFVLFRAADFESALRLYGAMMGSGPVGHGFRWRALLVGAALATLGPTAWTLVHRLPARPWVGALFGLLFALILFKIGNDANYEFIYFQF